MKFVAEDYEYQKKLDSKKMPTISTSDDLELEEDLNRINFSHLYNQQNFE